MVGLYQKLIGTISIKTNILKKTKLDPKSKKPNYENQKSNINQLLSLSFETKNKTNQS